jgi:hypothetical protein
MLANTPSVQRSQYSTNTSVRAESNVVVNKVRFRLFATAQEPNRDGLAAMFQKSSVIQ